MVFIFKFLHFLPTSFSTKNWYIRTDFFMDFDFWSFSFQLTLKVLFCWFRIFLIFVFLYWRSNTMNYLVRTLKFVMLHEIFCETQYLCIWYCFCIINTEKANELVFRYFQIIIIPVYKMFFLVILNKLFNWIFIKLLLFFI
jgi:hypothetical protein